jgi:hypothetical protein
LQAVFRELPDGAKNMAQREAELGGGACLHLLRRHLRWPAAGLVNVATAGSAGDFGRLAGGVFDRGRLHRLFGRRLWFDRVGLRLGKWVGAVGHDDSPQITNEPAQCMFPLPDRGGKGGFPALPLAMRLL